MSDAQAALILAAEDMTAAAFNSANRNLNSLVGNANRASSSMSGSFKGWVSSISSARSALASLGIVLSGRALFSWMTNAVQATTALGEQREEVLRAKSAFSDFKAASDLLGESLAVRLAPAISAVAKGLNEFRDSRDQSPQHVLDARIANARTQLAGLQAELDKRIANEDKTLLWVFSANGPFNEEAVASLRTRIGQLTENLRVLESAARESADSSKLEEIKVTAQRLPEDKIGLMLSRQREKELNEAQQHARELADAVALESVRVFGEEQEAAQESARLDFEKAERRRELLARQVDDLKLNLMTEVEFEAETYARQQEMLDAALQDELLSKQRHAQLSTELEQQTSQRIQQIRQQEAQREKQLQLVKLGGYANLAAGIAAITSVGAEDSKKKFETHKKIATAAAIVDTYAAVAYALRNPPGPPFSIPQAVAAGLFGFAQVKAIQSTTWSGGGAGGFGAAGGGGAEIPTASTINDRTAGLLSGDGSGGRGGPMINITITGIVGRVDGETAREIGRAVKEQIDDYDFEIMSQSSRQVMTIRGEGVQDEGP